MDDFLDFSLELGLSRYNELFVDSDSTLTYVNRNQTRFSPYISTNTHLTIGLNGWNRSENRCEFIKCYQKQDKILKVGLSDLFRMNVNNLSVNSSIAYERRIGESFFTTNSFALIGFRKTRQFNRIGDKTYKDGGDLDISTIPQYDKNFKTFNFAIISLIQELRYYMTQKKQIAAGTGAKNLNGIYLNGLLNLQETIGIIPNPAFRSIHRPLRFGIGGGIQNTLGSKHFFDLQITAYYNSASRSVDLHSKMVFGFAK